MNSGYLKNWLIKADNDIKIIEHELMLPESERVNDAVCFHCQQAAEKYLKALLIFHESEVPKTHNIEYIQSLLKERHPDISEIEVRDLSLFGVDIRYPDNFYQPTNEEVEFYTGLVMKIRDIVKTKINIED
jgi:HEPN domain-containing protein